MKAYEECRRYVSSRMAFSDPISNSTCAEASETQVPCGSKTTSVVGSSSGGGDDDEKCRSEMMRKSTILEESKKCNEVVNNNEKGKLPFSVEFLI
uniref:Uncharacterized protein n=1 Tax=Trichobilharzia regenti TaxID=157069 RepID=A0AA85JHQ7_TRIRE|nr:unnamed protein product [Trichobilharzia regenti]CAH8875754.1 unnamed protein product [Trichobilharzia regenti]